MRKSKESKLNQKIGRPRILEPTIPKEIFKKLRDIADEARMPMQLVYEDALLNGIVTLKDMYASAIQFRKTRDSLINESIGSVVQEPEVRAEKGPVHPASNGDDDSGFESFEGLKDGPIEASGDDFVGRGLREEGVADPELRAEYSGEPGE